jgi:hypothetical protein
MRKVLSKRSSISYREQFLVPTLKIIQGVNRKKSNVKLVYLEQLRERNITKPLEKIWEGYPKWILGKGKVD